MGTSSRGDVAMGYTAKMFASSQKRTSLAALPSPPHSKAAIDAAKLLNLKKFSMSSNMNMEHDSMVVNRLLKFLRRASPPGGSSFGQMTAVARPWPRARVAVPDYQ